MTFFEEFSISLAISISAVLLVILVFTSDFTVTILVAICVIMTDLFLVGLLFFWGLTLNPVVSLQIILAIGTSVDYTAHIAYAYLLEPIPEKK